MEMFSEMKARRKQMPETLYNRNRRMIIYLSNCCSLTFQHSLYSVRLISFIKSVVFLFSQEPCVLLGKIVPDETLAHLQQKPISYLSGNRGIMFYFILHYS